jgi:signal transduction histidine kinase
MARIAPHRRYLPRLSILAVAVGMVVLLLAALWLSVTGLHMVVSGSDLLISFCLVVATVLSYHWPIHLRPHTKVSMASVPYYLLAVLVPPPLAAIAGGLAALVAELSVQRARDTTSASIAAESGRRMLVVWLGALVAQLPANPAAHTLALVAAAIVMLAADILTCPLVLMPFSDESPLQIITVTAREAYLMEGAQYLLGLLGALAAAQQLWTMIVLAIPTALLYLAFRALGQAEHARNLARAAQEAAHLALNQAEEAVRVRDGFLLAGSHDLRTPLTAVLGRTDLLLNMLNSGPEDAARMRAQLLALRTAAMRMSATVEEMTDAAHLQMGQTLALNTGQLEVDVLVQEAAAIVRAANIHASIPISVEAPAKVALVGDRARLERVLYNIIGNAVKYSPKASPVHVEVQAEADYVTIRVRDHGFGIRATDLPQIFTPFYRAANASGMPGSGIGLACAKAIVEQHGGRITVESVVEQGTIVTVMLPHKLTTVPGRPQPSAQGYLAAKIAS